MLSQECMGSSRPQETGEQVPSSVPGAREWQLPLADPQAGNKSCPHSLQSAQGPLHLHTLYQGDNSQHTLRKETASIQNKSSPSIPEKMVEKKNLSSLPLMKTPKSQLTAEQPSTKDCNLPKKILHIQRQRKSHSKTVGGVLS